MGSRRPSRSSRRKRPCGTCLHVVGDFRGVDWGDRNKESFGKSFERIKDRRSQGPLARLRDARAHAAAEDPAGRATTWRSSSSRPTPASCRGTRKSSSPSASTTTRTAKRRGSFCGSRERSGPRRRRRRHPVGPAERRIDRQDHLGSGLQRGAEDPERGRRLPERCASSSSACTSKARRAALPRTTPATRSSRSANACRS